MRLEERMRTLPRASTDCREIGVEVAPDRASVTLVTRDGRRATRSLASPDELVPTTEALLVAPPPEIEEPTTEEPAADAASPESDVSFLFGAAGGARLGFPGEYASPTVLATGGVTFSRWDAALHAQWDAVHAPLGSASPEGFRLSTFVLAASLGRREPMDSVWIVYGAQLGVSFLSYRAPRAANAQGTSGDGDFPGTGPASGSKTEPRLGLYGGALLPRDAWIRFRSVLMVDVIPSRIGDELNLEQVPVPWWSAALVVGVEGELP
jgi:hypothetical protein